MEELTSFQSKSGRKITYYKEDDCLVKCVCDTSEAVEVTTELSLLIFDYNQTYRLPITSKLEQRQRQSQRHVIEAIALAFEINVSIFLDKRF